MTDQATDTAETSETSETFETHSPQDDLRRVRRDLPLGDVAQNALSGLGLPPIHDDAAWAARDQAIRAAKAAEAAHDAAQERERRASMLRTVGGFPVRAMTAAMTLWPSETPAFEHARKFLASERSTQVLAGGTGTGKTSAASWIALEAGGSSPAFIRAGDLESRGRYDRELRTWLRGCTMLVIDDLGVEILDQKAIFLALLDEIVDALYSDKKRLVITTNLRVKRTTSQGEPQFIERYGERIASRLHEIGKWSDCGTRDMRRAPVAKP